MKTNVYQKFLLIAAFLVCMITACSKMDSTYKKFLEGGDITYPGKADSVRVFPGHNRIRLSWLLTSDPSIVLCRVYWNNKKDSVEIPVKRSAGIDTISVIIDSLEEGYYNFEIYTYDIKGNISIATDTLGQVFGEVYANSLHNRVIKKTYWNQDSAFISWYKPGKGAVKTQLEYTDSTGALRSVAVPATDSVTFLSGYKLYSTFKYKTLFLPDSMAIDTFYTTYKSDSVIGQPAPEGPVNLALNKDISDKSSGCSCGPATNLTDGDEYTYWQPNGSDRRDDQMVYVAIDLGSAQTFNELNQFWTHGPQHIDSYTIFYSDDNSTWQTAYESTSGPDEGDNIVSFSAITARYVKLELHFADDGNVNIGEIEIYNDPNVKPPENLALNKTIADKSSDGSTGRAEKTIDGDQSTYWQPLGSDRRDDQMVSITIDLGSSETFNELDQYWTHGHSKIDSYKVYYSDDNSTWQTAYESTSGVSSGPNTATFPAVTGRYVKLELHFGEDGNVNIAEIEIWNR